MPSRMFVLSTLIIGIMIAPLQAADWPQFRGVNGSGIATGTAPIEFAPGHNEWWHVAVGKGHSSPCIVGDLLFLTASDPVNRELSVICLSRLDGTVHWQKSLSVDTVEQGHPSFDPASSTPASDGERVVVYFGSYGLVCFDLQGSQQWEVRLPLAQSYSGNATSPVMVGDRVIFYRATNHDHFVTALDKRTGETLWKTPQSERFTNNMACSATPVISGELAVIHGVRAVKAFHILDGSEVWSVDCFTTGTSTPVLAGNEVIIGTWNQTGESALVPVYPAYAEMLVQHDANSDGAITQDEFPPLMVFHRSEGTEAPQNGRPLRFGSVDQNGDQRIDAEEWGKVQAESMERRQNMVAHGMIAIRLDSEGQLQKSGVRTLEEQGIPEVPSPLYLDGIVYFVKNGGILTSLDAETGKQIYRRRTGAAGTHYSSPVATDRHLYTASGSGQLTVVELGNKPKIVARNQFDEPIYATPAIVDGVIYVRTHSTLYAFRKDAAPQE